MHQNNLYHTSLLYLLLVFFDLINFYPIYCRLSTIILGGVVAFFIFRLMQSEFKDQNLIKELDMLLSKENETTSKHFNEITKRLKRMDKSDSLLVEATLKTVLVCILIHLYLLLDGV